MSRRSHRQGLSALRKQGSPGRGYFVYVLSIPSAYNDVLLEPFAKETLYRGRVFPDTGIIEFMPEPDQRPSAPETKQQGGQS